jgi:hypothetical protein
MKTKSIIILIVTLIIGFAIGFMTNSHLTKNKIQSFVKMGTSDGFKERLYRVIKPDEIQRGEIEPILERYAGEIHEAVNISRKKMKDINEQMMQELEPFLNNDQIERMVKVQERIGRGRSDHRPPGPDHSREDKPGRR